MPIRQLPLLLVNQIAAGEVIERPASVVKELVENSLDAGARRVDVAVEEGGLQLIRIADDGMGMSPEDLPLALSPHATSKIAEPEDLDAIATLGFRGEALASIASVSRLRIVSRATGSESGYVIESSGDQMTEPMPISASPGTVMTMRDLFFNTPARRKFLRTTPTEFGHVNDTLRRIAMVYPQVGFTLTHNGRMVFELLPTDDRRQRCIDLIGKEVADGLMELEQIDPPEKGGARLWGLAGQPVLARSNNKGMYLYVNGRAVKDRNLHHALKEAYRGLMPHDKHPVAVAFLELDPADVDVNVHPAKAEVRFRKPGSVHGLMLTSFRQRLLGSDLTPSAQLAGFTNEPSDSSGISPSSGFNFDTSNADPANSSSFPSASETTSPNAFVEYFKQMDPRQKGFVFDEVKRAIVDDPDTPELLRNQAASDETLASQEQPPAGVNAQRILQVKSSYVVTEDDDGLVIVDQHALHERVMFEELSRRVLRDRDRLESQRLLMPEIVDASAKQQAVLDEMQPLLERIGIELEPIGPQAVAVQAFPSFLFTRNVEPGPFLRELIDRAESGDLDTAEANQEEAVLHNVLDMMACKAAVKAGDRMSEDELAALLAKRQEIERSSACPHGRPTTLRLTLKELEKQFGRV